MNWNGPLVFLGLIAFYVVTAALGIWLAKKTGGRGVNPGSGM
jgi:hypothetical protein